MTPITISPNKDRATYDRIVELLAGQFNLLPADFTKQYKVMPSQIIMARALNPGLSSYSFSPRKAVDPNVTGTVLLDQNDWFAADAVGLRVGRMSFAGGVYSNTGNNKKFTFPDPNFFTYTGSAVGNEIDGLMTIVNGTFDVSVQGDSQVDPMPAESLFFNPMSTYTSSPVAYPQFGGTQEEQGFYSLTPNLIFDASADNQFRVIVADGLKSNIDGAISTATTDSTKRNFLYVVVKGWKIKNLGGTGAALTCNRV
jgi:hypothetical protein